MTFTACLASVIRALATVCCIACHVGASAVVAAASADQAEPGHAAMSMLEQAIEVHGGEEALRAASSWVAIVKRTQRGRNYVLKTYYRPGMVRLEQENAKGSRSADVIGHPHCWGLVGLVVVKCSPATIENDRPRVVMEMAAQLWPLLGDEWEVRAVVGDDVITRRTTAILALYKPLNTLVRIEFDAVTGLLHSMQVDGRKKGVPGTHRHEYSEYATRCGVQMAAHNFKSFNGDIWVEENILSLRCKNVEEAFFSSPAQVATGTLAVRMVEQATMSCVRIPGAGDEVCFTPGSWAPAEADGAVAQLLPASRVISSYRLADVATNLPAEKLRMLDHARSLELQRAGPIRLIKHDRDGMGLTGEVIYELQLPVAAKAN